MTFNPEQIAQDINKDFDKHPNMLSKDVLLELKPATPDEIKQVLQLVKNHGGEKEAELLVAGLKLPDLKIDSKPDSQENKDLKTIVGILNSNDPITDDNFPKLQGLVQNCLKENLDITELTNLSKQLETRSAKDGYHTPREATNYTMAVKVMGLKDEVDSKIFDDKIANVPR